MLILGIETTCDETSLAIVEDGKKVIFNELISQISKHSIFGGVVPEIAAREHYNSLFILLELLKKNTNLKLSDIDAIAVSNEPGLIGSLLLGVTFAKTLALIYNNRIIGINHLYAHLSAANIEYDIQYPYLGVLVSGGHTVFFKVTDEVTFQVLGRTLDDAAGECFDKVAKMLGLGYPGGPIIDKLVKEADKKELVNLHFNWRNKWGNDVSFSGLKTSVLYYINGQNLQNPKTLQKDDIINIAYTTQEIITDIIVEKTKDFIKNDDFKCIVVAGGVAANSVLRTKMKKLEGEKMKVYIPSIKYCIDNAAMVATLGYFYAKRNLFSNMELDCKSTFL
jgi:N6-L-threonylcarbamoyladenine synthase